MNDPQQKDDKNNNEFICGVVEGFYGKPWSCDQRKDLFKRLKKLKLNAFMYAPKDDTKHRSKWRHPYSEQEANELKSLIEEAKENGIDFYYSLAPGLDMIYSDREELNLLIRKYDQLVDLGCKSFAILFDDIEPSINELDRDVFKNYATAQVSVTNMIYEHLKRPKFLFCPTEYCESRAVPNVTNSFYLKTLGAGLEQGIDIMWSGSRVISKLITEESIEMLTKVIRRPPVIWENLHANDYDKKRVFLGPYSGRSTKIIPKLKGVLTNPNCEYEANYIAIHTLAQWSKCTEDVNLHNRCNPSHLSEFPPSDINSRNSCFEQLSQSVYDPYRALTFAIRDWLPRILENKSLPTGTNLTVTQLRQRSDESANNQLAKECVTDQTNSEVEETNVEMTVQEETNQSPANSISTNKSEMDTSSSPAQTTNIMCDTNSCDSCDMQDVALDLNNKPVEINNTTQAPLKDQSSCPGCIVCGGSQQRSHVVQREPNSVEGNQSNLEMTVNFDHLSLLVDLFYLPFEHGSYGYTLLKDIKWLQDNSDVLIPDNSSNQQENKESRMNEDLDPGNLHGDVGRRSIQGWLERAENLNNLCTCISRLVNTLIYDCPNKSLIAELYPYLADMRDVAAMIVDYIKFLRYRTSTQDRFYNSNWTNPGKQKDSSCSFDEQEPWAVRGGLVGDVQRLLS